MGVQNDRPSNLSGTQASVPSLKLPPFPEVPEDVAKRAGQEFKKWWETDVQDYFTKFAIALRS